ncbi:MAG TPA: DUF4870 domain-containing protein [Brumimicrobium sp.]|nr:DUF4870 domain-containing protein [Brumimicrobium sp.]
MTEENNQKTDTTVGLVAYLTLIGFIIALVLNNDKKGEEKAFGAFHLRQSIGLMLTALALMIGMMILSMILFVISIKFGIMLTGILYPIIYLGILALVIIGIINAANGQKKELPVVGPFISKIFGKAFE